MKTDLGLIALTDNQILNWKPFGIWVRFHYIDGHVIAVSDVSPAQSDINALIASLSVLPDVPFESDEVKKEKKLRNDIKNAATFDDLKTAIVKYLKL